MFIFIELEKTKSPSICRVEFSYDLYDLNVDRLINQLIIDGFGSFRALLTLRLNQAKKRISESFTWIMLLIIRFVEDIWGFLVNENKTKRSSEWMSECAV